MSWTWRRRGQRTYAELSGGEGGDGAAMRACLALGSVDLVLLDPVLPGGEGGLSLALEIRAAHPEIGTVEQ